MLIYIIINRKQYRYDRRNVQLLELYYCVDGFIYQSPVILDLIRTRIAKTSYHLLNTLNLLLKHTSYTVTSGPICYIPNVNDNNDDNNNNQNNVLKINKAVNKQFAPNREFPSLAPVLLDLGSPDFLKNH